MRAEGCLSTTLRGARGSDTLHGRGRDTSPPLLIVPFGKGPVDLLLLKSDSKFFILSE